MVAWLKREQDLPAISRVTLEIGVKPSPLSFYCIRATPKPAFVFGFAGWTPAQIREKSDQTRVVTPKGRQFLGRSMSRHV